MNVTLNAEQRLYVIPCGDGYTCLGFDNARSHADQIAARLQRPDLAFASSDHGSLDGYAKYQAAIAAWGRSQLTLQTYFDPGTDPKAARALEMGAAVVKPDGQELTRANIGQVLATRDLMADLRSADPFRQGGGKAFSKADRSRFLDVLDRVLRAAAR